MPERARVLIETLGLTPHPEGGHFREIFRAPETITADDGRVRSAVTVIYFLLRSGESSRWHQVDSAEIWHFVEGDPLELLTTAPNGEAFALTTLAPLADATAPIAVVPARHWQAARPLGDYTLVACTVGPGFDFADFRFADPESLAAARLRVHAPGLL